MINIILIYVFDYSMIYGFYPGSFKPPHIGHFNIVKTILPKVDKLYIIIGKKSRDNIDQNISKNIWNLYLDSLSDEDKKKIVIFNSNLSSPINTLNGLLKILLKQNDTFYLLVSDKNGNNKNGRFNSVLKSYPKNGKKIIIPNYGKISSSDLRKLLEKQKFNEIGKYIPKNIDPKNFIKLTQ